MANAHRRVNQIGRIRANGVMFSNEVEIREGIVGFYQHLFRDEGDVWRPGLDGVVFYSVSETEVLSLERPFSEEEVLGVLRSMAGDKAPGPDDFLLIFFNTVGGW